MVAKHRRKPLPSTHGKNLEKHKKTLKHQHPTTEFPKTMTDPNKHNTTYNTKQSILSHIAEAYLHRRIHRFDDTVLKYIVTNQITTKQMEIHVRTTKTHREYRKTLKICKTTKLTRLPLNNKKRKQNLHLLTWFSQVMR